MRITRDDHDRLVTVNFPWPGAVGFLTVGPVMATHFAMQRTSPWFIVFAIAFALATIVGTDQFLTRIVFDFDKRGRELTWTSRSPLRRQRRVIPFCDVRSATVNLLRSGNARLYRLELHTSVGTLPITPGFSSGRKDRYESVAERINWVVHASDKNDGVVAYSMLECNAQRGLTTRSSGPARASGSLRPWPVIPPAGHGTERRAL